MASTLTNLLYHVVFSTKGRLNLIPDNTEKELHAYMGGIVRAHGGVALGIDGTNNHVHMLIKLKPAIPLPSIIRFIKTGSSKWMNELPITTGRFNWQTGYRAFSVSESQASRVLNYIRNQKRHHQEQTFENELVILLRKHAVSYDAKYIWD